MSRLFKPRTSADGAVPLNDAVPAGASAHAAATTTTTTTSPSVVSERTALVQSTYSYSGNTAHNRTSRPPALSARARRFRERRIARRRNHANQHGQASSMHTATELRRPGFEEIYFSVLRKRRASLTRRQHLKLFFDFVMMTAAALPLTPFIATEFYHLVSHEMTPAQREMLNQIAFPLGVPTALALSGVATINHVMELKTRNAIVARLIAPEPVVSTEAQSSYCPAVRGFFKKYGHDIAHIIMLYAPKFALGAATTAVICVSNSQTHPWLKHPAFLIPAVLLAGHYFGKIFLRWEGPVADAGTDDGLWATLKELFSGRKLRTYTTYNNGNPIRHTFSCTMTLFLAYCVFSIATHEALEALSIGAWFVSAMTVMLASLVISFGGSPALAASIIAGAELPGVKIAAMIVGPLMVAGDALVESLSTLDYLPQLKRLHPATRCAALLSIIALSLPTILALHEIAELAEGEHAHDMPPNLALNISLVATGTPIWLPSQLIAFMGMMLKALRYLESEAVFGAGWWVDYIKSCVPGGPDYVPSDVAERELGAGVGDAPQGGVVWGAAGAAAGARALAVRAHSTANGNHNAGRAQPANAAANATFDAVVDSVSPANDSRAWVPASAAGSRATRVGANRHAVFAAARNNAAGAAPTAIYPPSADTNASLAAAESAARVMPAQASAYGGY